MASSGTLDFGYPWWLSYGHLACFVLVGALAFCAWRRRWPRWLAVVLTVVAVWALSASALMKVILDAGGRATLPTETFLSSGTGRVVDLGAGTGRSTIMVLDARPRAELVAVDLFGGSFDQHFGKTASPQERLRANLRAAGHDARVKIEQADIRQLPFPDASFDGAVSAYVIDHLGRDGARQAFSEARRVLKPGADLLFIVIANDAWTKFAFGPLLVHSTRSAAAWAALMEQTGFRIVEQGNPPGLLYILGRNPLQPN
jgi:ubiquinone/menaquinone biosynthesis C-methylase UbiE